MTARQPRREIVTSASDNHWARYRASNDAILFTSETYKRKRDAEHAIDVLARSLDARLTKVGVRTITDEVPPVEVRYVKHATKTKRPTLPEPGSVAG